MLNLLRKNPKIIINSDLDGIISGLVLHHFLGCEIVGFSNSSDTVWIDETRCHSIYDAVYIDMFVPLPNVGTIDQHIISINSFHHTQIRANKNKINPNLYNPRFHLPNQSYYKKYPFGTVHFILAYLEKEKIDLSGFDIHQQIDTLYFKDLLLRADDAMQTSIDSNYSQNAKEWWRWLQEFSDNGEITHQLINYLDSLTSENMAEIKLATTQKLKSYPYFCDSPDGGIRIITDENNYLKPNVKVYFSFIAAFCSLPCFALNQKLTLYKGINKRIMLSENQKNELIEKGTIDQEIVFSYAFVRSSGREQNFSYTVMK